MSEASKFGGIIHLAGQVADDDKQDITGQTKQVLAQVDRLLATAGSDKSRILMMQIFLKDVADFAAMNAVYDTWVVPGHTSPRATVRPHTGTPAGCCRSPLPQVQASLASPSWLIEVVVTAAEAPSS